MRTLFQAAFVVFGLMMWALASVPLAQAQGLRERRPPVQDLKALDRAQLCASALRPTLPYVWNVIEPLARTPDRNSLRFPAPFFALAAATFNLRDSGGVPSAASLQPCSFPADHPYWTLDMPVEEIFEVASAASVEDKGRSARCIRGQIPSTPSGTLYWIDALCGVTANNGKRYRVVGRITVDLKFDANQLIGYNVDFGPSPRAQNLGPNNAQRQGFRIELIDAAGAILSYRELRGNVTMMVWNIGGVKDKGFHGTFFERSGLATTLEPTFAFVHRFNFLLLKNPCEWNADTALDRQDFRLANSTAQWNKFNDIGHSKSSGSFVEIDGQQVQCLPKIGLSSTTLTP